jgi:spermidine synthase
MVLAEAFMTPVEPAAELLDRKVEDDGATIELYRRGEAYEVRLDGRCAMASDVRRSEKSLAELAVAPLRGRDDVTVLVAGLGMGHLVRQVLDAPGVKVTRVDVVERSRTLVEWESRYFAALNGDAMKDSRVQLHDGDLLTFLKQARLGVGGELPAEGWYAVVLDTDEGPSALSRPGNAALYTDEGLAKLEGALRPGGVVVIWSAGRESELARRLSARFQNVAEIAVPTDTGLEYVYRGRRQPPPATKPAN